MGKKRRNAPQACAYCGKLTITTDDHVVARCLFKPPYDFRPPDDKLVVVPACQACNNAKSRDDVFLRDLLAIDHTLADQPGIEHLQAMYRRSAEQDKSMIARIVESQSTMARDPASGLHLPHLRSVKIERGRLSRALTWLVRGLYFHEHDKTILAAHYRYNCTRVAPAEAAKRAAAIFNLGIKPKWGLARGEFSYVHLLFEDPNVTFWQMIFYNRACYEVSSVPPDVDSLADFDSRLKRRQPASDPKPQ